MKTFELLGIELGKADSIMYNGDTVEVPQLYPSDWFRKMWHVPENCEHVNLLLNFPTGGFNITAKGFSCSSNNILHTIKWHSLASIKTKKCKDQPFA